MGGASGLTSRLFENALVSLETKYAHLDSYALVFQKANNAVVACGDLHLQRLE